MRTSTRTRTSGRRRHVAFAAKATQHPRATGVVLLVVAAAISYVVFLSVNGVPFQQRHRLLVELPPGTAPVDVTDQVRIAGQRAGMVKDTRVRDGRAEVELEISPDYWPVGDRSTVKVRIRVGTGLTFLDLNPAGTGALEEGDRIPLERVGSGTTLTEVAESFDEPTRAATSGTLVAAGAALLGHGEELNAAVGQFPAILREGTPVVDALTPAPGVLGGLVDDATATAGAVSQSGRLPELLDGTATTAAALAARSDDISGILERGAPTARRLAAIGPRLDRFLTGAGELVDDLRPLVVTVDRQLPAMRRLLEGAPELRAASERIGPAATVAFRYAPGSVAALRGPVTLVKPLVSELEGILTVLEPYQADLRAGVQALGSATSKAYPQGFGAPGNPAMRGMPILTCAPHRNPYPAPRTAEQDQGERGDC